MEMEMHRSLRFTIHNYFVYCVVERECLVWEQRESSGRARRVFVGPLQPYSAKMARWYFRASGVAFRGSRDLAVLQQLLRRNIAVRQG